MSDQNAFGRQYRRRWTSRAVCHFQNRKERRRTAAVAAGPEARFVAQFSPKSLVHTFYQMQQANGQAPGVDRIRYGDMSAGEIWAAARAFSETVNEGRYRPQQVRQVRIPKSEPGHFRTLRIRCVFDRVIATALSELVESVAADRFHPSSYGFRKRIGTWHLLAAMTIGAENNRAWVLATDDIANAFDNVPIAPTLAEIGRWIEDPRTLRLAETILKGGDDRRTLGIDQGCPFSPTALNVLLHHVLDVQTDQNDARWVSFRYVDNLAWLMQNPSEVNQPLLRTEELLRPTGMRLKGMDGPPIDLRTGATKDLLGFTVRAQNDRMEFTLSRQAWGNLTMRLQAAHESENPPETAWMIVQGWIQAYGPAFRNPAASEIPDRIMDALTQQGFNEVFDGGAISQGIEHACSRWESLLRDIRTQGRPRG